MGTFGEKIRLSRALREISLVTLAKAVHVTPSYLSKLERGKASGRPSDSLIDDLALYLYLDASDLRGLLDAAPQAAAARVGGPRVDADLRDILIADPQMGACLRILKRANIDGAGLLTILEAHAAALGQAGAR